MVFQFFVTAIVFAFIMKIYSFIIQTTGERVFAQNESSIRSDENGNP